jgi:hypothetical protein
MHNIPVVALLLENEYQAFPVIHKAGEVIDTMAEIKEQVAQVAGKAPVAGGLW